MRRIDDRVVRGKHRRNTVANPRRRTRRLRARPLLRVRRRVTRFGTISRFRSMATRGVELPGSPSSSERDVPAGTSSSPLTRMTTGAPLILSPTGYWISVDPAGEVRRTTAAAVPAGGGGMRNATAQSPSGPFGPGRPEPALPTRSPGSGRGRPATGRRDTASSARTRRSTRRPETNSGVGENVRSICSGSLRKRGTRG